ncbi:MAG: C-GCAxxG-C-C family (seleno)protein [Cetobacterium sp.]|uniref:C-GCAxxG-C-C family (seleno)protein n=1 Tax=Cetobacterium sp. TaxID=2071632 RepID=UPI003F327152
MKKNIYTKGELNCAETIIAEYNKNNNTKIPVSLGSGLGSGLTCGSICGAINAAAIIIGFEKGRNSKEEVNNARILVNELLKDCKTQYGSEICIDLKNKKISCEEIVDFAYNKMVDILKK